MKILASALTCILFISQIYSQEEVPAVHFTLDQCYSNFDGASADYTEFISTATKCANLFVEGDNLGRANGNANQHSCTEGINNSLAMCVSADESCVYTSDSDKKIQFEIMVTPVSGQTETITGLEFYQKSPEFYSWTSGTTGRNNTPQFYALRITANGEEIYLEDRIATTEDWALQTFDFSSNSEFGAADTTSFLFELTPYCPNDIGANVTIWDVDDIKIFSAGDESEANGGALSSGPYNFCINDDEQDFIPDGGISLTGNVGDLSQWIVTDEDADHIMVLPQDPELVNFNDLSPGTFLIWHMSINGTLDGLQIGASLSELSGCYDLSNSVEVINSLGGANCVEQCDIEASTITGGPFTFCVSDNLADTIATGLISVEAGTGEFSTWLILDAAGQTIVSIVNSPYDIDFESSSEGTVLIRQLSYSGDLGGIGAGEDIDGLTGCFALSNAITVSRIIEGADCVNDELCEVSGGTVSGGPFTFCVVDGEADLIPDNLISLSGNTGPNNTWVISDADGSTILDIVDSPFTVDFEGVAVGTCLLWHLSYDNIAGLQENGAVANLSGCFSLSQAITINRIEEGVDCIDEQQCDVSGGSVSGGPFTFCVIDGNADLIPENLISLSGNTGPNNTWVITDADGSTILDIVDSPFTVDFEGVAVGTCLLWHLSYDNIAGLQENGAVANLSGCFSLSQAITINRIEEGVDCIEEQPCPVSGGSLTGGPFTFCVIDGNADLIPDNLISLNGNTGPNNTWVITDADGSMILDIVDSPFDVDFEGLAVGTCLLWHLSYDNIAGLQENGAVANLGGCFDLSNSITISRIDEGVDCIEEQPCPVSGGSLIGGPFTFCVIDGNADLIPENLISLSGNTGPNNTWVITDADGSTILDIVDSPFTVDFEGVSAGTCLLWHLSYDNIAGLQENGEVVNLGGCYDLSNSITISRIDEGVDCTDQQPCTVLGGALTGGPFTFCVANDEPDIIPNDLITLSGNAGTNSTWIVTDADGSTILDIVDSPFTIDFEGVAVGTCLLWHLSYDNIAGLQENSEVANLSGCFSLSNAIAVNRIDEGIDCLDDIDECTADGGVVRGGPFVYCVVDGAPNFINDESINLNGNVGNSLWLLTDSIGTTILDTTSTPSQYNINDRLPGECQFRHLSYFGELQNLTIGSSIDQIEGCFDISDAGMRIIKNGEGDGCVLNCEVERGEISGGPFTFCPEIEQFNVIPIGSIILTGNVSQLNTWLLIDSLQDTIVQIVASPQDITYTNLGNRSYQLRYIGFEPGVSLATGTVISSLAGCFGLTNAINLIPAGSEDPACNEDCNISGGSIVGGPFNFCVGDGESDIISLEELNLVNNIGSFSQWIITDVSGATILDLPANISNINFDEGDEGSTLIWHLSYEGLLNGLAVGSMVSDFDGCFSLSNSVALNTSSQGAVCDGECIVNGGVISGGPFEFCVNNGEADTIAAESIAISNVESGINQWVITNNIDSTILELPLDIYDVDFDNNDTGSCLIWHVSYEGILNGLAVGSSLSEFAGCFSLSNSIEVIRASEGVICTPGCPVVGGTLTGGPFNFCVDDGIEDMISMDLLNITGQIGNNHQWILTDESATTIIGLPANINELNFDVTGEGSSLLWNLAFEDDIQGVFLNAPVSDILGCFSLSNSVLINRFETGGACDGECLAEGGSLSGGPFTFCVNDGEADFLPDNAISSSGNLGATSQWVVTDADGRSILALPESLTDIDFDQSGNGTCLIWNISYDGLIEGLIVDSLVTNITGCYDLSNSVIINRVSEGPACTDECDVTGGSLTGGPFDFCIGDGEPDIINNASVSIIGATGPNNQWVITDSSGTTILGLPPSLSVVDFDETEAGVCLIWNISYEGELIGAEVDALVSDISSCISLSDSIVVNRFDDGAICSDTCNVDGGILVGNAITFCVGDGRPDNILAGAINVRENEGQNFAWVITDDSGNSIIELPENLEDINFENTEPGTAQVFSVSYDGEIAGLEVGGSISALSGCLDISNSVIINKDNSGPACLPDCNVIGGEVIGNTIIFCSGDGQPDIVDSDSISITLNAGQQRRWLVTDGNTNSILAINEDIENINFDNFGEATVLIWSISFDFNLEGIAVGDAVSGITGCYDISTNNIQVIQNDDCARISCMVEGGTITGGPFTFCIGDGEVDTISSSELILSRSLGEVSQWLVTDAEAKTILDVSTSLDSLNFDNADAGECLLWHVSTDGETLNEFVGTDLALLPGCYDLSNSVLIVREDSGPACVLPCTAETAELQGGPFAFCVGDGVDDNISIDDITVIGGEGENSQWIITNPAGTIIGLPESPAQVNFDGVNPGICNIQLLNYNDAISGLGLGFNIRNIRGCIALSNVIEVQRSMARAATISGGPFEFCVGNGIADQITPGSIQLSGASGANTQWVITDEDGIIITLSDAIETVDFDEAGIGVCLIWHIGFNADLEGLELGEDINELSGCFGLSESIQVNRISIDAGTLSGGPFMFCQGDGEEDRVADDAISLSGNTGDNSQWVVTDNAGTVILGLPDELSTLNFDQLPPGTSLIWNISYFDGLEGLEVSAMIVDLVGCFDLSNSVEVIRVDDGDPCPEGCNVNGGSLAGGPFTFCVNDNQGDIIFSEELQLTNDRGDNNQWIITDVDGSEILMMPDNIEDINWNRIEIGTCLLWNLSFEGNLNDVVVDSLVSNITGCFELSNSIEINRVTSGEACNTPCNVFGGTIEGGPFTFCVVDGQPDIISESEVTISSNGGQHSDWIVTDTDEVILGFATSLENINFELADEGECLLWNISYDFAISNIEPGGSLSNITGCYDLSENSISVFREGEGDDCEVLVCSASSSTLSGGPFTVCVQDNVSDIILADDITVNNGSGDNVRWIITDAEAATILDVQEDIESINFDSAPAGICLIWQINYEDGLTGLEADAPVALLSGCYALSNSLEVNRQESGEVCDAVCIVGGGTIAGGPFTFCVGDGAADMIGFTDIALSGHSGEESQWVITDEAGEILGLPTFPSEVNFEDAGIGVCLVWHLSYDDELPELELGNNTSQLEGCFAFSNSIEVNRVTTDGGSLTGGPFNFCIDATPDIISQAEINLSDNIGSNAGWVITDESGEILGLPPSPQAVDFNDTGEGTCLIWNISYEDGLEGLTVGENVDDLEGCFSFSNSIVVNRSGPVGGTLSGGPFSFCTSDDLADIIPVGAVSVAGNSGNTSRWVITDGVGESIIGLPESLEDVDFQEAGIGLCKIWNISYNEDIQGLEAGANVSDLVGCFSLSTNSIDVVRASAGDACAPECATDGGTLVGGPFNFCVGDDKGDMIADGEVTLSGNIGTDSQWIVTDEDNNILGLPANITAVDFDIAGAGTCQIWNVSYQDSITGLDIGQNISALEGCFDISNGIEVIRTEVGGGMIEGGPFEFCVGDDTPDIILDSEITLTDNVGDSSQWVVTNGDGSMILGLPSNISQVDFDDTEVGTCLIWHLSYGGDLIGLTVDSAVADLSGCFSLSNSIAVTRSSSGAICGEECTVTASTITGGPFDLCVSGDDIVNIPMDDITVVEGTGTNKEWLLTTQQGSIIAFTGNPGAINLSNLPTPLQLIRIDYESGLSGANVGVNINALDGCFALSETRIIISLVTEGEACGEPCPLTPATLTGGPFSFCSGDDINDNIAAGSITIEMDSMTNFQWIQTDSAGFILGTASDYVDINFDDSGTGSTFLSYLKFEDGITGLSSGMNISNLAGCFRNSNLIEIITAESGVLCDSSCSVEAGVITGGPFTFCVGDGAADTIATGGITLENNVGTRSEWLLTDSSGVIIFSITPTFEAIGFDQSGATTFQLWHISYDGELTNIDSGDRVNEIEGCFDISTNSVEIILEDMGDACDDEGGCMVDGGDISGGPFTFCVGDGVRDTIPDGAVTVSNNNGENSRWLITDAVGEFIIGTPSSINVFDFDSAQSASWQLFHLTFDGELEGLTSNGLVEGIQGCYALSSNSIMLNFLRDGENCDSDSCVVDGGTLSGGPIEFCINDGMIDTIAVSDVSLTDNIGENSIWILTDSLGETILADALTPQDIDFDNSDRDSISLLWHLSYTDSISDLSVGTQVNSLTGCFSLSSNSVTIIRTETGAICGDCLVEGGDFTGGPFTFCLADSIRDTIAQEQIMLDNVVGENSRWLITNEAGDTIIGLPQSLDDVDFTDADPGTCLLWHLSFEGTLLNAEPGLPVAGMMGCFDLSDSIVIERLDAGPTCGESSFEGPGRVVLTEIIDMDDIIEIQNIGTTDIDISSYFICPSLLCFRLDAFDIECENDDFNLEPGEIIAISNDQVSIESDDGEVGLFSNLEFAMPENMVDYVEWGAPNHPRSSIAVTANLWTEGDFVAGFNFNQSLNYDGDGDASSDWAAADPSTCTENNARSPSPTNYVEVNVMGNPVFDELNLNLENPHGLDRITMDFRNLFGDLVKTTEIQNDDFEFDYSIDLSELAPGLYFLTVRENFGQLAAKIIKQ